MIEEEVRAFQFNFISLFFKNDKKWSTKKSHYCHGGLRYRFLITINR